MKSLYKLLEELTYKCEGMGTSNTSIENCSLEINEINTYLNNILNTTECFYFSLLVILNLGEKRIAPLKHFAQHLKCKPIDVIESIEILNNFYKKGIVERVSDHRDRVGNKGFTDYSYYVSDKQFQQLLEGTIKFEKSENKVTTGISLIKKIKLLTDRYEEKAIDFRELMDRYRDLLSANQDLEIVDKILRLGVQQNKSVFSFKEVDESNTTLVLLESLFIFCVLAHSVCNRSEHIRVNEIFETVFDEYYNFNFQLNRLFACDHEIFHQKLLIKRSSVMAIDDYEYVMTKKFYSYFGIPNPNKPINIDSGLIIKYQSIKPKQLVFNKSLKEQLDQIANFLQPKTYNHSIDLLVNRYKFPKGVCILFHGEPGTGKTEYVYQLARESKRNLYKVDISKLRSMWYGKSEILVREEFENYRMAQKSQRNKPILFINEADALFGKRLDIKQTVDQTNNSIQNILLEELENFEGILICTTNLLTNLDDAFERRFLYKVKFEKPDTDLQHIIWQNNLPQLSEIESKRLAFLFDLCPAQIVNIARKVAIKEILGEHIDFEIIKDLAEKETSHKRGSMGFKKI